MVLFDLPVFGGYGNDGMAWCVCFLVRAYVMVFEWIWQGGCLVFLLFIHVYCRLFCLSGLGC